VVSPSTSGKRGTWSGSPLASPSSLRAPAHSSIRAHEQLAGTEFRCHELFPAWRAPDLAYSMPAPPPRHHLAIQGIADDLEKIDHSRCRRAATFRPRVIKQFESAHREVQRATGAPRTAKTDLLQIYIADDGGRLQAMFFDIADQRLGITSSVALGFRRRKGRPTSASPLGRNEAFALQGRVDSTADRSPKHPQPRGREGTVAEIV